MANKLIRAIYEQEGHEYKGRLSHLDNGFGRPACDPAKYSKGTAKEWRSEVGDPTCWACQHKLNRGGTISGGAV